MRLIVLSLSLLLTGTPSVAVQTIATPQFEPAFEVASVKVHSEKSGKSFFQIQPSGRLVIVNQTLRSIVISAYDISPSLAAFALVGGSDEILNTRFDIQAQPPAELSGNRQQSQRMLRALLLERFDLWIHSEKRDLPVYALTVARDSLLGTALRRTIHDCEVFQATRRQMTQVDVPRDVDGDEICTRSYQLNSPRRGAVKMRYAGPLDVLVRRIQSFVDRPVVDMTGLAGNFDWVVSFSTDPQDAEFPSVFCGARRPARPKAGATHSSRGSSRNRFRANADT